MNFLVTIRNVATNEIIAQAAYDTPPVILDRDVWNVVQEAINNQPEPRIGKA